MMRACAPHRFDARGWTVRYRKRPYGALRRRAFAAEALAASDNGALLSDDAGRAERAPDNFR